MVHAAMTTPAKPPATESRLSPDAPGVIVFPPLLFTGTLLLGLGIHLLWPMRLAATTFSIRIVGVVLVVVSGVLSSWASRTMRRAGTNVLPSKPTLSIVSDGPFRFSRNPLYIAGSLLYLGLTLIFNSAWPLALFVPMLIVLDRGVVRREERYLETKFGDDYRAYKTRVHRWL